MSKYFYVARPTRWTGMKYVDLLDDERGEWHEKARALQVRRWRALKRAGRQSPKQNTPLKV